MGIKPHALFRAFVEAQDASSAGLDERRSHASFDDPADIRQLYVEIGRPDGIELRLGRQTAFFGAERLVGERNWSNLAPSWDAARLILRSGRDRLDVFAMSQVSNDPDDFDAPFAAGRLHGFYGSLESLLPASAVEPYLLYSSRPRVRGGLIDDGPDAGSYTGGVRVAGEARDRLDFEIETALQRGHARGVALRGWMGAWGLGYRPATLPWDSRLGVLYEFASGDDGPSAQRIGAFDPLFAARHSHLGIADVVARRNLQSLKLGWRAAPHPKLSLETDYLNLRRATARDGVYRTSGALALAAAPDGAGPTAIGDELDVILSYQPRADWEIEAGTGLFFPARFVNEALGDRVRRTLFYLSFEMKL